MITDIWAWINSLPLIERGGWVMMAIILLSMVAAAIILDRVWFLLIRGKMILPRGFLRQVQGQLDQGMIEEAVVSCRKNDSMMARVLLSGLYLFGEPRGTIREALEDAGRRESRELERWLGTLAAIAGVTPLLGLLGTVLGMIDIFNEIATQHIGQYEHLSGGIFKALYTTAAGLIVAIPTYLAYRGFAGLADKKTREMEDWAVDLVAHLSRAKRERAKAGNAAADPAREIKEESDDVQET